MISSRLYRKILEMHKLFEELKSNAGKQFDPERVNVKNFLANFIPLNPQAKKFIIIL